MALHITDTSITSDVTPETAYRVPDQDDGRWLLTWLPDRLLSREQAVDGMMLDELLSDPTADGAAVMRTAAASAASLEVDLTEVLVRLYARVVERDSRRADPHTRCRRHALKCVRPTVPQRFLLGCASVSTVLARTLFAVATLPSLAFVTAALLTARLTPNGWAVTGITLATSAVTCTLTLSGRH